MKKHISITGDLGSGKSTVSKLICQQAPFEYFSTGSLQRQLAAQRGMNTLDLNKASEGNIDVDKYIDDFLRHIEADSSSETRYILDSRMAWFFVPSSFKVYLKVSPQVAARRVMADKIRSGEPVTASLEETMESLRERKESECRRFMKFYQADYRDLSQFDLVVDVDDITPEEAAGRILEALAVSQFGQENLQQIEAKGMTPEKVAAQLQCFADGFPYLRLAASASLEKGGGILSFSPEEEASLLKAWDAYLAESGHKVVKFVPASGAASRMFKDLFAFLDAPYDEPKTDFEKAFCAHCQCFAFSGELDEVCRRRQGKSLEQLAREGQYKSIVANLLGAEGLNYGQLPKGLLTFHRYEAGNRKAMVEHLVEGALYTADSRGNVWLHFTVSPEHRTLFEAQARESVPAVEAQYGVHFHIGFSEQKASTDTIAADKDNRPFRDKGRLLFRPGGHGALIENLNELDGDIVFIKNIDNVVPDGLKDATVHYKKVLAGLLVSLQAQAADWLRLLESGRYSHAQLLEIDRFLKEKLFISHPEIEQMEDSELAVFLKKKLDRPMRVCGMVRNLGEPGGGPFLAYNRDGSVSLQILESSQIDMNDPEKAAMFRKGTHFNPVDLVCAIRNWKGEKYDLPKFVDPATGFISSKSKNGQELKALELPGLWNGAMSDWNTVFVEVPIETFNPVKTVNDLLRVQHQ